MFKAADQTFQEEADALFALDKKAVIVSVDETGKKIIDGNYSGTNWTYDEARHKIVCLAKKRQIVDLFALTLMQKRSMVILIISPI